jgi:guanine deaminase
MTSRREKESFMERAIADALRGIERGHGGPFGAVIVRGGEILAMGHNEVLKTNDPTRHAEICAISRAAAKLGAPHFRGCEIYSTTEPCVMCFAAINWAQIRSVYFGTSVRDVKKLGFNELTISNRRLRTLGGSKVRIVPGLLRKECRALLEHWRRLAQPVY